MKKYSNIGVVGLGVMGSALARNIESKGFSVSVYNRSSEKVDLFKSRYKGNFSSYKQIKSFIGSLEKPRKIILMVSPAAIDEVIESVLPYLSKGDVIIDGGNSYYEKTQERQNMLESKKIHYLGLGVSGGEKGALEGPAMMAGGDEKGWDISKHILESISSNDFQGNPSVAYLGQGGSGHLVKMVHNGIEYAVMQTLSETYQILKDGYQMTPVMISEIFRRFNEGRLNSFLVGICEPILRAVDEKTDKALIDVILDQAGQKGTGRWTARDAIEYGVESSTISQSVHARVASSFKKKRVLLSNSFKLEKFRETPSFALEEILPKLEQAIFCNWIVAMEQGLNMISTIAEEKGWEIDLQEVVRVWQGKCIIQARLLEDVYKLIGKSTIFESKWAQKNLKEGYNDWKDVIKVALELGVPTYALSAGIVSLQSDASAQSSANFIQAMRDYFGAHTFKRVDESEAESFHNNWE